jgi:hypothetical protein
VIDVATLDRIEPAYTPWTPSKAGIGTTDEEYSGRHRRLGDRVGRGRVFSLRRLFYVARHRRH